MKETQSKEGNVYCVHFWFRSHRAAKSIANNAGGDKCWKVVLKRLHDDRRANVGLREEIWVVADFAELHENVDDVHV